MKEDMYKDLVKSLNELDLFNNNKLIITEAFNQIGIDLNVCSCCMDITNSEITDGFETYCSVECLKYS